MLEFEFELSKLNKIPLDDATTYCHAYFLFLFLPLKNVYSTVKTCGPLNKNTVAILKLFLLYFETVDVIHSRTKVNLLIDSIFGDNKNIIIKMAPPNVNSTGRKTNNKSAVTSTALVVAGKRGNPIDAKHENLMYKIKSFECFQNLPYQRQCMEDLFSRVFTQESTPNSDELLRLLQALSLQAPTLQLPLPVGFIPLIRFDAESVPYFEFHYFTQILPLMHPLNGTDFLKTVDKHLLDYSAAILESMAEAHVWATHGYPIPQNLVRNSISAQPVSTSAFPYQGETSNNSGLSLQYTALCFYSWQLKETFCLCCRYSNNCCCQQFNFG